MAVFEHYMNEMNKFNRTSQFPVLVVGMTSELNSVAARIQACFLHQLKMTPPTETQRQAMLSALSLEYNLAPEIDLVQVAKQTAGFVMGDYVTLFTHAFDKAFEDATKYRFVPIIVFVIVTYYGEFCSSHVFAVHIYSGNIVLSY